MHLLHIISTPRGHESNTIRVSNTLIEALYSKYADLTVSVLDLFQADLPAVAGANIESKYKLMTSPVWPKGCSMRTAWTFPPRRAGPAC